MYSIFVSIHRSQSYNTFIMKQRIKLLSKIFRRETIYCKLKVFCFCNSKPPSNAKGKVCERISERRKRRKGNIWNRGFCSASLLNVYVKKQACHSNQQGGSCFCFLSDAIQTKYMSMCVVTMHFATFLIVSVDTKLW